MNRLYRSLLFAAALPGQIHGPIKIESTVNMDQKVREIRSGGSAASIPLSALKGKNGLVLFFFSEQCGVTYYYKSRIQILQQEFESKGFKFVGVRSGQTGDPSDALAPSETSYLKMRFVDDFDGRLVGEFGVEQSLTFAAIDSSNRLRYFGGFDDQVDEKKVTFHYLRDALDAINRGNSVKIKQGSAIGCAIIPIRHAKT